MSQEKGDAAGMSKRKYYLSLQNHKKAKAAGTAIIIIILLLI